MGILHPNKNAPHAHYPGRGNGDIRSLELLEAERTAAESASALAEADAQIADAQVDLFRALGGGWASPT